MKLPPVDLTYIAQCFETCVRDLLEVWSDNPEAEPPPAPEIVHGVRQLILVLCHLEDHASLEQDPDQNKALKALGEHGLQMFNELSRRAAAMGLASQGRDLRDLCLPFALWVTRRGGGFTTLQPVADAVAELANRLSDSGELAALYGMIDELIDATVSLQGRTAGRPAAHPWRILVLNRAIVATRSHQTALIELAFSSVAELLPDEAPAFFEEALEKMDIIGYPDQVRTLVERYFREHCSHRTLH